MTSRSRWTRRARRVTAANFLRYVDGGYYDGGRFHRTVRPENQPGKTVLIEVVQAGLNPEPPRPGFEPIRLERTRDTGLLHREALVHTRNDRGPARRSSSE